jgi:hypothetical protein
VRGNASQFQFASSPCQTWCFSGHRLERQETSAWPCRSVRHLLGAWPTLWLRKRYLLDDLGIPSFSRSKAPFVLSTQPCEHRAPEPSKSAKRHIVAQDNRSTITHADRPQTLECSGRHDIGAANPNSPSVPALLADCLLPVARNDSPALAQPLEIAGVGLAHASHPAPRQLCVRASSAVPEIASCRGKNGGSSRRAMALQALPNRRRRGK